MNLPRPRRFPMRPIVDSTAARDLKAFRVAMDELAATVNSAPVKSA